MSSAKPTGIGDAKKGADPEDPPAVMEDLPITVVVGVTSRRFNDYFNCSTFHYVVYGVPKAMAHGAATWDDAAALKCVDMSVKGIVIAENRRRFGRSISAADIKVEYALNGLSSAATKPTRAGATCQTLVFLYLCDTEI